MHLSRRLKCTIVITSLLVVNFSHFLLLDRKQDLNVPYQVCVFRARADRKKQGGRPGLWLADTFWLLNWNRWTEFNQTWQEARSQRPLPSLCFSGWSEKQDDRRGLWWAETILTYSLNGNQLNLTESKVSTSYAEFLFFWADWKNKMAALAWFAETFSTSHLK